jgi:hypothetical protein
MARNATRGVAPACVGPRPRISSAPAKAASRVNVIAKCDGHPEKVIVQNSTRHRIKVKKVGSIYRPYDFEPKTFNKTIRRRGQANFESGPAANNNIISKQYIFNSDVGSREGARVATSIGRFVDHCD